MFCNEMCTQCLLTVSILIILPISYGIKMNDDYEHSFLVNPDTDNFTIDDSMENDIIRPDPEKQLFRNGAEDDGTNRWPNCVVPYSQSRWKPLDEEGKVAVRAAFEDFHTLTCVRFVVYDRYVHGPNWVEIKKDRGCYSYVGMQGGRQAVSIGDRCQHKGIAIHELMHTIGFYHEQSRSDRDAHVLVIAPNIANGMLDQFEKLSPGEEDTFQTLYDYRSVMHYRRNSFSRNGQDTLQAYINGVMDETLTEAMGQRLGFSNTDLIKINRMCNCPQYYLNLTTTTPLPTSTSTSTSSTTSTATTTTSVSTTTTSVTTTSSATTTTSTATTSTSQSTTTTTSQTTSTRKATTRPPIIRKAKNQPTVCKNAKGWWFCKGKERLCTDRSIRSSCQLTCKACGPLKDDTPTTTKKTTAVPTRRPTTRVTTLRPQSTSSSCRDRENYGCSKRANLCKHSWWGKATTLNCPKTCGRC